MDAAQEQVRKLLAAAELQAAAWEAGFWLTDAQKQVIGTIRMERATYDKWATTWRTWAEVGTDAEGYEYSVSFWLRVGGDIASALKLHAASLYDASAFAPIVNTVKKTAEDVADGVDKAAKKVAGPWDWKVKAGLTVVGVGVIGYAVNALAKLAKAVAP